MPTHMGISRYIIDFIYYVWLYSLLNTYYCDNWGDYISLRHLMYWDVSSSPLFDIISCTCIDLRLGMNKGLTRGDRPLWDRVMIIWPRGDRLWDGEAMIIIRAREDCPCEIYLIYDSALRSSAQTRGDRPCRYMYLVSPTIS